MHSIIFYILSSMAILSAISITSAANLVRSVLLLVLCFLSISGLCISAGADYMGMTIVIVYVGSVSVLFLFAVMMVKMGLDISVKTRLSKFSVGLCLLTLVTLASVFILKPHYSQTNTEINFDNVQGAREIGMKLYDQYALELQALGVILLISMIGVVYLGINKTDLFKYKKGDQKRDSKNSVYLVNPKFGKGVSLKQMD